MKRIVIFLSALFLLLSPASAQNDTATATKQINSIKMSSDYIFAESTATTEQEAKDNARLLLEVNIEEWIKSKQSDAKDIQGYVAKAGNSILEVKTTRGNRFRVFLYVRKNDIMTFSDATEIIAAPMQQESQQTVVTTTAAVDLQQEIITKPAEEKPAVKEEKSSVKEEKPAAKKEKAAKEEKPAKADKKAKSSKSKKEEPVNEEEDDASDSTADAAEAVSAIETEVQQAAIYTPTVEERKMIAVTKFDEIKPFITNNPGVRDYGKFADMPAMGKCYLFVYDREGAVKACLLRGDNGYTNVMNGAKDNIDNYKGCGAIWFRYNN